VLTTFWAVVVSVSGVLSAFFKYVMGTLIS
jgi:hypothetical protein